MHLALGDLRYLTVVADAGSLGRAAETLDVAQSVLSRCIQRLERELGATLLTRHNRGVAPTAAGAVLLERARVMLRQEARLREAVAAAGAEPRGSLRVGFPPSLGAMLIAPAVAGLAERGPAISIGLLEGFSEEISSRVRGDQLDLGIVSTTASESETRRTPLFAEELWLVGPPRGWSFRGPVAPDDVAPLTLLVTDAVHRMVDRWAASAGGLRGRCVRANSQAVLLPLCERGLGHLVVPRSAVASELARGRLTGAPLRDLLLTRHLIERQDAERSAATRMFVEELGRHVALAITSGELIRVP